MEYRALCDGGSAFLECEIHCKNFVEISGYKAEGIMECIICQDTVRIGEEICIFPCSEIVNHKFHKKCIMPWLEEHDTCPVCRSKLN